MAAMSIEAYFLGAKSENADSVRRAFDEILRHWFDWRSERFPDDDNVISDAERKSEKFSIENERLHTALKALCDMLLAETPTFTPRYLSHMLSEASLPALFGHLAALLHNPNNTSREVSRVGARVEVEAIAMLADMIGFNSAKAQGHFTSGGTIANFEAVWRARYRIDHALALGLVAAEKSRMPFSAFESAHMGWAAFDRLRLRDATSELATRAASSVLCNPLEIAERISKCSRRSYRGPVLITPGSKHFSWRKAANIFHLGEESLWNAPLDNEGRLDMGELQTLIEKARREDRPIIAVVSVAGTTEAGEIDPIDSVTSVLNEYRLNGIHIWHHVDAAYGGYFCSMLGSELEKILDDGRSAALKAIRLADSVTIDPHKLGYVPYACGAFLTRDERLYTASTFNAPYIDRAEIGDKWQSTIEGSRTAAGAAATWLSGRTMGFEPDCFGAFMASTINARRIFAKAITSQCKNVAVLEPADTNILCFSIGKKGDSLSYSNKRTDYVFGLFQKDPSFSVSKTVFDVENYCRLVEAHAKRHEMALDDGKLSLIRCVFMNPFLPKGEVLEKFLPKFIARLNFYAEQALELCD
ncbi:pyridoxal phosphate-dependent decarboxylase family protein [Hyphococcus luteus]|nr:pyridoxal-dependent decarboxylase [Marinicaulis flavus]